MSTLLSSALGYSTKPHPERCTQVRPNCSAEKDYSWCQDIRVGGCKGPWAQCHKLHGCLEFVDDLPAHGVKIYSSRDRQSVTREKADQLIAKGIDFTVIYDHPEHLRDHDSLPKVDPPNPEVTHHPKRIPTHQYVEKINCDQRVDKHVRWVVHHEPEKFFAHKEGTVDHWDLSEKSEYQSCRDAKNAALAWAQNYRAEELHGPHILADDQCTDKAEANVKYEFKGHQYDTCLQAKQAALRTAKVTPQKLPSPKDNRPKAPPPVIRPPQPPARTCGTQIPVPTCGTQPYVR